MEEDLDKFIIRIFFAFVVMGVLFLYRLSYRYLHPSLKDQFALPFNPLQNPCNTLIIFSRVLGVAIIYSSLKISLHHGIWLSLIDLLLQGLLGFILFIVSIYILESITLYNFEYEDEVIKRKNISYSIISFSQAITLSFIVKCVLDVADHSIPITLFLWLLSLVVIGFSIKSFKWLSRLSFNKLIIQKDITLGFSFSGFVFGLGVLIVACFSQSVLNWQSYATQVILNILKASMVFPVIKFLITKIFKVEEIKESEINTENAFGYGLYEGILFLTCAFFTAIIINQIYFGSFYPQGQN
jgi:uncharacterized membrane protein YjfL (UPF0719 family)